MPRCPVCGDPVEPERSNAPPFCSDRCRTVDLGRWLGESYGLPRPTPAGDDEEEDEPRAPAGDGGDA